MLPAVLATLAIGIGAAAAQTGSQGAPIIRPSWPAAPLPTGQGGVIMMAPSDVRVKLEAEGYSNISDLRREGNIYNAMATKDGGKKRVTVDARNGEVLAAIAAP
jgi:hypothetical protein